MTYCTFSGCLYGHCHGPDYHDRMSQGSITAIPMEFQCKIEGCRHRNTHTTSGHHHNNASGTVMIIMDMGLTSAKIYFHQQPTLTS